MGEFFWHQDGAFLDLVGRPLAILGAVFIIMVAITIGLVIISKGGSDDA